MNTRQRLDNVLRQRSVAWKARKPLHSTRCEQSPRGSAAPQIHMQVGPRKSMQDRQGAPKESPQGRGQDFGHWPQAAWTVHCTTRHPRTLVPAAPIKRTPLSNPLGPRRGTCRRPARTQGWQPPGGKCPRIAPRTVHPRGMWMGVANPLPVLQT